MAEHPFRTFLSVDGAWVDVTGDVRQTSTVRIVKGGGEVSEVPRPSTLTLTLNDPAGRYRPDRAASPLYGKVGRNTPVSVPGGMFEVSGWKPDRTVDHDGLGRGDQVTEIDAGGILRRIGTWTDPVVSALTQTITADLLGNAVGYWPIEDGELTQHAPTPVVGLAPSLLYTNGPLEFGITDAPAGANASVNIPAASTDAGRGRTTGQFVPGSQTAGWQFAFAFRLPTAPPDATFNPQMFLQLTGGYRFDFWMNSTTYRITALDPNTGVVDTTDVDYTSGPGPTVWTYMVLTATHTTSSTTAWVLQWYSQNGTFILSTSDTAPIPSGALDLWEAYANYEMRLSQVIGVQGVSDNLTSFPLVSSFNGWVGETAAARFGRLMDLSGLPWTVEGDPDRTVPMGAQRALSLPEHLREIRDSEDGRLYDDPDALGVTLRTRLDLYSQTPALRLTYGVNVAAPFLPVLDDLNTANVVTADQRVGGSYTARDDTSIMGTLPPPDGVGEYKKTLKVNLSTDAALQPRAEWGRAIGTNPEARYASVVVDLDANPELETAVSAVRQGDRITVAGADPDVVDLMVVGVTDSYDTKHRRTVTFTCSPYRSYDVGAYDDTIKRYDSGSTTLAGSQNASSTAWSLTTANLGDVWSTTPGYDLLVAGERVHVSSMGAATGTGPYVQPAVVVRSVNGVVKTHAAGEPVHVATPGRYGL